MEQIFSASSIALNNLRRRKRQYLLLAAGIVLAVYFVAVALFFGATMYTSLQERHHRHYGKQDAIVFNCGEALAELTSSGVFSASGKAEILAYVLPDGQSMQNGFSIARYDQEALKLTHRELITGRLPEKPGEIALEQSMLARLRLEAGVGERINLNLLIPDGNNFMEEPLKKSYTLVGVLGDQLIFLQNQMGLDRPAYSDSPAGVLAEDEQIEAGGRPVINCYGIYSGDAKSSFEKLDQFCMEKTILNDWGWANLIQTRYQIFRGNFNNESSNIAVTTILLGLISLVLVGAACLGIINAFSADLESRRRQIGLLRAVGATKKQIKQIFGREAFLLSLFSIPPALALAALTVWGITKVLGEAYTFHPGVLMYLGIAAAGLLCVKLAASFPLARASRIPPLQAIRNVDLFRQARRSRLQSQMFFEVPLDMARRHRQLYPSKLAGITIMLASSIVLVSLAVFALTPALREAKYEYGSDYVLRSQGEMRDWLMEYSLHLPGITGQDKADVAALAGVKSVTGEKNLQIKILPEKITPYILEINFNRFDYLFPKPHAGYLNVYGDQFQNERLQIQYSNYQEVKAKYGYNSDFLTVDCCGADEEVLSKLRPFVIAGKINPDKLNSGREILIIAPQEYGLIIETHESGWNCQYYYEPDPKTDYSVYQKNDMFQAGDELTISLLYCDELVEEGLGKPYAYQEDGSRKLPDDAVRIDRTVTIGAILTPQAGENNHLGSQFSSYFHPEVGDLVTTTAGLQALGFDLPYKTLAVNLAESPDAALEEYLEANLKMIAARTAGVECFSYVALARENRQAIYGLLVASAAILILLFAICASMINNALSARLRAGRREIGTLRAVGASGREIERSYRWQMLSMFAWGTIIGLAAELAICGWLVLKTSNGNDFMDFPPIWQPLLFVALMFGLCYLSLRAKVGAINRESIVENIREL